WIAGHVAQRVGGCGQAGLGTAEVASTALRINTATAVGCESAIECEASTSTISRAPARCAMWRSASGGMALSAVATIAHDGSFFQAAAWARSSKIAPNRRWL